MRRLSRPEHVRWHPRTQVICPDRSKYREPRPNPIRFQFEAHTCLSAFIQGVTRLVTDGGGNSSVEGPRRAHFRRPNWPPLRHTR